MRDGRPQAVHTGHAVVLGPKGRRWVHGDADAGVFWRSCAKPFQALPAVETISTLGLTARHLSAACGSHASQTFHVQVAREILAAADLDESYLRCGVHPVHEAGSAPRPAGGWTPIHNNCSAKHALMLATCVVRGWPVPSYAKPDHPLQLTIGATMSEATREPLATGGDGCGLPTYWNSLEAVARAFIWLGDNGQPVLDAMGAHPFHYGGTHRLDSNLALLTGGGVIAKIGAVGVHAGIHRPSGTAFAIKVDSGDIKARDAATAALISGLGWTEAGPLRPWASPAVKDNAGRVRGELEALFVPPPA